MALKTKYYAGDIIEVSLYLAIIWPMTVGGKRFPGIPCKNYTVKGHRTSSIQQLALLGNY